VKPAHAADVPRARNERTRRDPRARVRRNRRVRQEDAASASEFARARPRDRRTARALDGLARADLVERPEVVRQVVARDALEAAQAASGPRSGAPRSRRPLPLRPGSGGLPVSQYSVRSGDVPKRPTNSSSVVEAEAGGLRVEPDRQPRVLTIGVVPVLTHTLLGESSRARQRRPTSKRPPDARWPIAWRLPLLRDYRRASTLWGRSLARRIHPTVRPRTTCKKIVSSLRPGCRKRLHTPVPCRSGAAAARPGARPVRDGSPRYPACPLNPIGLAAGGFPRQPPPSSPRMGIFKAYDIRGIVPDRAEPRARAADRTAFARSSGEAARGRARHAHALRRRSPRRSIEACGARART
jgi:hypothetical protein